jgi:hypothetical protein
MADLSTYIRGAIEILSRDGWAQFQLRKPDGRCCIEGAFLSQFPVRIGSMTAPFLEFFELFHRFYGETPAVWNDYECASKEEAINKLLDMLKRLEAENVRPVADSIARSDELQGTEVSQQQPDLETV